MTEIVFALAERNAVGDFASIACKTDIVDSNNIALGTCVGCDREVELDSVASIVAKVEGGLLPT